MTVKQVVLPKFKKDYISWLALFLFILIVVAELALAIWLPYHLRSEKLWARQVAYQEMVDFFDSLRREVSRFKSRDDFSEGEAGILCKELDDTAIFLREYSTVLPVAQINELTTRFREYKKFFDHIQKQSYSGCERLDAGPFLQRLKVKGMDGLRKIEQ